MEKTLLHKSVLVIDDDTSIGELLQSFLEKHNCTVTVAHSGKSGLEQCKNHHFDFVLCDFRLGDKNGFEMLEAVRAIQPGAKVIIITAYSEVKTAVAAIKMGAVDFITKPLVPDELLAILKQGGSNSTNGKVHHAPETTTLPGFWASQSPVMKELYDEMELIAPVDYSVIIYGESGTGKEMMARAIHAKSKRKFEPFVALDCGTLSKELAASELFGHVKGSFTGAHSDKVGQFEQANNGTLFLDEIGNLPLDVQASLLRVVQERKYRRIGDSKEHYINVRILVASNENLQLAYQKGSFREDLYHRFNEFKMNLPPLRNRKEDIMPLATWFLMQVNKDLDKSINSFSEEVQETFLEYSWPGNLRELKNIVRRAALLTKGEIITRDSLPIELFSVTLPADDNTEAEADAGQNLKKVIARTEKEIILNILSQVKNNKTKAAAVLKIDRKTLYNKLKEFGIIPAKALRENPDI
ncbi:sigma-54-dependent transcriptional regulator [Foetidibacter luteolus]|uniref:sigma-54-dependent transcriptional regulator n=1 Tax=Foetidibacter luteolus TaxID=2608880 RepID=UPI00129BD499|nr:sigma-54 dependent transcriptional regulator [Foetidibacter luteolus]